MKNFIFIPDTNKGAGLGHLFRCYQYSNFVNKDYKIIFLINKNFDPKYLIHKNERSIKISYIFFSDLKKTLGLLKKDNKKIYTFIDSYNKKLHSINFNVFSIKHIAILDFKIKNSADFILDHTFKREKNFHTITSMNKIFTGLNNFPIIKKLKLKKRNTILINFGSIKNKTLISKSLIFIKKLNLDSSYKIIIINKYFNKKDCYKLNMLNQVICYKFFKNIDSIYERLYFTIGACGISLYEKCFYHIPSISKCVAKNQYFNFVNFFSNNCILSFDQVMKIDLKNLENKKNILDKIHNVENNLKRCFDYNKNRKNLGLFFKKI
jgi:spore coat polysaccharide biosynthesis predicted glycosyltransferase SpsG